MQAVSEIEKQKNFSAKTSKISGNTRSNSVNIGLKDARNQSQIQLYQNPVKALIEQQSTEALSGNYITLKCEQGGFSQRKVSVKKNMNKSAAKIIGQKQEISKTELNGR